MITVLAIALIAAPVVPWAGWSPTRRVDAAAHLSAHCLDCHGGGTRKGKLDLDPVVAALRAGELDADQRAVLRRARARIARTPPPAPQRPLPSVLPFAPPANFLHRPGRRHAA
jgi:cytochrome c553